MASKGWDFSGLATKYNTRCADGRTIISGAFSDMDGKRVPLIYNHDHKDPKNILGYAILHSVDEGLRADAYLDDDSTAGQEIKRKMKMGTPFTYSIHATDLRQKASDVLHGIVREVSVVLAGANPGATIDSFALSHALDRDYVTEEEALICFEDVLTHSLDDNEENDENEKNGENELEHSDDKKESEKADDKKEPDKTSDEETFEDVVNSMTQKQRDVYFASLAAVSESKDKSEGGKEMAHGTCFDSAREKVADALTLTHADKVQILEYAETLGSFKKGLNHFVEEKTANITEEDAKELMHGLDQQGFTYLLPEFKNVNGEGERELWTDDMSWVNTVISGAAKVPFARVKTETIDARGLRGKGWKKGEKKLTENQQKVLHRETSPDMIIVTETANRKDILDLKDNFEYVPFLRQMMAMALKFELAYATLFGDGRESGTQGKISEEAIRPIWTDDELYAMHVDLDIAGMAASLQGTDTNKYFGEGFVASEALVKVFLDAMIDYHGRGNMVGFMDPLYVNKLLLARDRDGHRMYKTKDELASALGLAKIETVQQIKDLENRKVTIDGVEHQKKLVCIAINMQDYCYGNVKGGEVTHFEDFDIDYNQYKYLDETYLSGAIRKIKSAIIVEEDVTAASQAEG